MNLSDALDDFPGGGGRGNQSGQPANPAWPNQPSANPMWPGGQGGGGAWPGGQGGGGGGAWPGGQGGGGGGAWPGGQAGGGGGAWPGGHGGGGGGAWPGGQGGGGGGAWPGGQGGGGGGAWPGGQGGGGAWPGGQGGGGGGVQPGGQGGGGGAWPHQPGPGSAVPVAPQQNLAVPYSQNLPNGVYDKLLITIAGLIKPNADKITVDLATSRDVAFHFNPRFNEAGKQVIVRNTCTNKKWGKEERELPSFPFVQGQPFEIKIMCTNSCFKVAVNNSHLIEYKHRITDLRSVNKLNIGNDLQLVRVNLETLP